MNFENKLLKTEEKVMLALRSIYHKYGYAPFKMSRFEEYDLYAKNKDFLVSGDILTFTDLNGKLLAMKPDVTLSIIKNYKGSGKGLYKVYYNENVYRTEKGVREYKEIMQSGIECIGNIDIVSECEVLMLAAKSLEEISENYILDIASVSVINGLLNAAEVDKNTSKQIIELLNSKNVHSLQKLCEENSVGGGIREALIGITNLSGNADEMVKKLENLCINREMTDGCMRLKEVIEFLSGFIPKAKLRLDFSIVSDTSYYSGIVFRGYVDKLPKSVLSGGRYDKLLERFGKKGGAVGFAVYSDMLERLDESEKDYDADVVVTYDKEASVEKVFSSAQKMRSQGLTVSVMPQITEGFRAKEIINITGEEEQ